MKINPRRLFLSPFAKALVDALTSTRFHLLLLVFSLVLGVWFYKLATEQFAPEVQRITIKKNANYSYEHITIHAALNHGAIKDSYGVNQCLIIELDPYNDAYWENDSIPKPSIEELDKKGYTDHGVIHIAFSGRDLYTPDAPDSSWIAIDGVGKKRIKEIAPSVFEIEDYSNNGGLYENICFHGNDIFYKSKSRNPYIAFYLKFDGFGTNPDNPRVGGFSFYYNKVDNKENDAENFNVQHPINLISSYPPPSSASPVVLTYDDEAVRQILEDGLYVIAEDLSVKKTREKESFFFSMLLGALISWVIQLVVSIVRKWKAAFTDLYAN